MKVVFPLRLKIPPENIILGIAYLFPAISLLKAIKHALAHVFGVIYRNFLLSIDFFQLHSKKGTPFVLN